MPRFSLIAPVFFLAASGCSSDSDSPGPAATAGQSVGGAPTGGSTNSAGGGSGQGGSGGRAGGSSSGGTSMAGSAGATAGSGGSSAGAPAGGTSGSSSTAGQPSGGTGGSGNGMSFFVTSQTSKTGKLGGLKAADQICQTLAAAAGVGSKTWRAYLSADADPDNNNMPVHAGARIGEGPWYNQKGVMLAADLAALHARKGDAEVFLDEKGIKINGQWSGSPTPNQHDIFTGSKADGTLDPGKTCGSWTSEATEMTAAVGHSDGLGPGMATTGTYASWNASHYNGGCNDTSPKGGAGRFYCFATD